MRVLLTHRFFWPDTAPYASILRAIGARLADEGHDVTVLASIPSYRTSHSGVPRHQTLDGMAIRRVWVFGDEKRNPLLRLANVVLYCVALFWAVLRHRPDVVTAAAFPPVFAAWTASLAARLTGARFVYHVQDIHPEVSVISGGALGRGVPMRLMRWLDNQTLRRSAAIVVLSQDMAQTLAERRQGNLPIHVINNFELDTFETSSGQTPALSTYEKAAGKRRVIFAGNLGRFQNLPLLAEGVALLFDSHPDLELFFLGDGTALPDLKSHWEKHPQVKFGPFLPYDQAKALIAGADIGLASLLPGVFRVAYPSKVLTYLALGVRVLALVEPESQLAHDLRDNGHGQVPLRADPAAIADALRQMLDHPKPFRADTVPVRATVLDRWSRLFASLVS